ncbi:MAG: hypothetical protein R2752_02980 [Vicinamibacterales bacterium]
MRRPIDEEGVRPAQDPRCRSIRSPSTSAAGAHEEVARQISARSITLLKDDRNQWRRQRAARITDPLPGYAGLPVGQHWRAEPTTSELRTRWPNLTPVESLSDASSPGELDLVRASVPRYDAIVGLGVRVRGVGERPAGSLTAARETAGRLARASAEHVADGHGLLREPAW